MYPPISLPEPTHSPQNATSASRPMNCRPLARPTVHTREKTVSTVLYSKKSWILSNCSVYRLSIVAAGGRALEGLGPAAEATLEVLEWKGLCHQVAAFASTSLGKRSLSQLVPATTEVEVRAEIASTRAVDALESEYAVELEFGGVRTLEAEGALRRAARGGLLSADALLSISSLLLGASKLKNAIGSVVAAASGSPKVLPAWQAMENLDLFPDIVRDIGFNIAPEGEFWSPLAPCVKESASDQVKRAAQKLRTVDSRLRNALKSSIGKQFVGSGAEISEYANRLCLSVHTTPHNGKFAGVVLGRSGSSWFIEPESVVALNNEYQATRTELAAAEEVVLWDLTGKIMEVVDALNDVLNAVVWMDERVGKARYGRWIGGMLPNLNQAESTATDKLAGSLCHPLLLASYFSLRQQNSTTPPTPVDIRVPSGTSAVVITGPNTGGKTAVLKTLGLAVLACNSGIPIASGLFHRTRSPLDMVFFDKVLADIGDEQSLSSNLSTFSGHLTRIAAIQEEATPHSLVLLDELGTGTDPVEGAALGIAVLKSFQKLPFSKLVVATTHHSSLSSLKYSSSSESSEVENASVEFDQINLVPTYRLLWGIPGRSHAFSIARRLGLDPEVVGAAEERVGGSAAVVEELIVELESVKRRIAEDGAAARSEENEGLAAMERTARVRRQIREEADRIEVEWRRATATVMAEAKAQLHEASLALKKKEATKVNITGVSRPGGVVEDMVKKGNSSEDKKQDLSSISVGDTVYVGRLKKSVKVLEVFRDKSKIVVQAGPLKLTVPTHEITK